MNHDKIQLAQVGCGYWGPNLLRNFSSLPGCDVKYVVEQSEERRNFVRSRYPTVTLLEDAGIVWTDPAIDAVVVATPARSHFALAKAALESGKHVFVEKPLAMNVAEADELIALARRASRVLMVGHTFLYNDAVAYLKKMIATGELGEICYAYSQRLNLGIVRSDINAMWNLAPHDASILCHLFDATPLQVSASGGTYLQPGLEDVVFMQLQFPGAIRAHVHVSWLDPNKTRRVTVVGSKKMVVYDDVAEDKITIYDKGMDRRDPRPFDAPGMPRLTSRAGNILIPPVRFKEPLLQAAEDFVTCAATGGEPRSSGAGSGRAVVATLEAAQISLAGSGGFVPVPTLPTP